VANFGAAVAVQDSQGVIHRAVPLKKLPHLVAGDRVRCEPIRPTSHTSQHDQNIGESEPRSVPPSGYQQEYRITHLHQRSSVLERPDRRNQLKAVAANLTQLVVVAAVKPEIDLLLIDQFCLVAEQSGIDAVVVLNKSDLASDAELQSHQQQLQIYASIGYKTAVINTLSETGIKPLRGLLRDNCSVLVGQSGVGKSSIVQNLLPDIEVRVGAISKATGIGAHTTTVSFRYELPGAGVLIDSPGVRHFPVDHLSRRQVAQGYREIAAASAQCKFANCSHQTEPRCHVQASLKNGKIANSRYQNYVKLINSEN